MREAATRHSGRLAPLRESKTRASGRRTPGRTPGRAPVLRLFFSVSALFVVFLSSSCGAPPPALDLGWTPDSPAVYRVSTTAESGFSGAVSDLGGATRMTATFRVSPAPDSAEVEVLYLAANVEDAFGDPVALNLGRLAGNGATVRFGSPGVVSEVEGDEELLEAPIPLISVESVLWHLFPPLPEGSFRAEDTWTADMPPTFSNLGEEPVRMRYVVQSASPPEGSVEGYELSVEPRPFEAETPGGGVSGEGHLDVEFEGELHEADGYRRMERSSRFDSDFIRLEGGSFANGNVWMEEETVVERLNPAEQFGLDP